jgi:murein DD-endopeptidase MepM/ murein hydrolase activator NlpD
LVRGALTPNLNDNYICSPSLSLWGDSYEYSAEARVRGNTRNEMFKSRKRYINFLIIPEDSLRNISFRLSFWKTWTILGLLGILIIVLIILSVLYGKVIYGGISVKSLRLENERLKTYNAKVVELEKELQKYRSFARRVAELAGIEYPFSPDLQKRETNLALPREDTTALNEGRILSSLENTEAGSKLSVQGESEKFQFVGEKKGQTDSDSLRRIPKGQPIDGWITRGFSTNGYAFGGKHTGIDFAAKESTKVKVTADGTVSFVGWDDVYGNLVVVDHKNGYVTYYGHNSKILVNSGNFVRRGEVIALSGNSGISSAPHLHYEIKKDDIPIDPSDFLNLK